MSTPNTRLSAEIIGHSPAMRALKTAISGAARCDATALVTGESGTGKELVARQLHFQGKRRAGPFVAVNCGALSESLLESELFGYVRGAFTGATADRKGLFEAADRGTIFLDEIGETSPAVQVKLLRVLQERKVRPVGCADARERAVDVRVIAATNRDLASEVAEKNFRQDLYYRVNVLPLHLPPLRERRDDIPDLAAHLLAKASAGAIANAAARLTEDALAVLCAYPWPGNVRELENVCERLLVITAGANRITRRDVCAALPVVPEGAPVSEASGVCVWERGESLDEYLERHKRDAIRAALVHTRGNVAASARLLKVSRPGLSHYLTRAGMREATKGDADPDVAPDAGGTVGAESGARGRAY